jgi:hypothetical protein
MIFGDCPYCDAMVCNSMTKQSPAFFESVCEHCGKTYWVYATRLGECLAYTQEDFDKEYIKDVANKTIEKRKPD